MVGAGSNMLEDKEMNYISIDLETTGLNPNTCQILQFAAVFDSFSRPLEKAPILNLLLAADNYSGEPYALAMHSDIFKILAQQKLGTTTLHGREVGVIKSTDLVDKFICWISKLGWPYGHRIVCTGKNFATFDLRFLQQYGWNKVGMHHRVIDVGSFYLCQTDIEPPSTKECLGRAGLPETITHDAVEDALQVCQLIRRHFNEYTTTTG